MKKKLKKISGWFIVIYTILFTASTLALIIGENLDFEVISKGCLGLTIVILIISAIINIGINLISDSE